MKLFNTLIAYFLIIGTLFGQGNFFTLEDSTKLYLQEIGKGQSIIFIPGWTMTGRFFEKQMTAFAEDFHALTYDPRGQGKSSKSFDKNNYAVHADDLQQIIKKKGLADVILVGWSSGCLTVYEYLRAFGETNISKLVLIDEPPKWIGNRDTEWVYGSFNDYKSSLEGLITQPTRNPNGIIDWMLKEPIDSLTRKWMQKEILLTPNYVALPLYVNGLIANYTKEVITYTPQIPTLFMVQSTSLNKATKWLQTNAPAAKVVSISSHAMFWEQPTAFNHLLKEFLKN